ncbi:MAG: ABC transporter ATP-binding protein [Firmicutes bacterium]|nr:ABC transporter ATP-binding protein [Bacillota bacterium]
MIISKDISKSFGGVQALKSISLTINKASVFGLVGTNGAGKSTFLRLLAGIYKPDSGEITIDGQPVWENIELKKRVYYISDEQYFFANATPLEVARYYNGIYPNYDMERFHKLMQGFELPVGRKINTFSKGMKKQVSVICGLAANTDYIFCDETFDGLDPVMRHTVKSLFAAEVAERELTPIIASHNLRELEDICDHVGLLHRGGVLMEKDLDDMKLGAGKVQCVLPEGVEVESLGLDIAVQDRRGSLVTIIARGVPDEIAARVAAVHPVFMEVLPLTLEEYFIMETEVAGYDLKNLFL